MDFLPESSGPHKKCCRTPRCTLRLQRYTDSHCRCEGSDKRGQHGPMLLEQTTRQPTMRAFPRPKPRGEAASGGRRASVSIFGLTFCAVWRPNRTTSPSDSKTSCFSWKLLAQRSGSSSRRRGSRPPHHFHFVLCSPTGVLIKETVISESLADPNHKAKLVPVCRTILEYCCTMYQVHVYPLLLYCELLSTLIRSRKYKNTYTKSSVEIN